MFHCNPCSLSNNDISPKVLQAVDAAIKHTPTPAETAAAAAAAAIKSERAELTKASWDQRNAADESWRLLLMGAPSGIFVVRAKPSSSSGGARSAGADVLAVITVVKPGGRSHFNQLIVRAGDRRHPDDGSAATLDGSKHTHSSIEELVKFYQDPMYFAQATELDVPTVLIMPSDTSFDGTGANVSGGGGGGGGAGSTMTLKKKARKHAAKET